MSKDKGKVVVSRADGREKWNVTTNGYEVSF
jgi:hypothetical protein